MNLRPLLAVRAIFVTTPKLRPKIVHMFKNELVIIIAFATACIFTLFVMPSLIAVAKGKQLFYKADLKTGKNRMVPLGGIAIFIGLCFGSIFSLFDQPFDEIKFILASLFLIFFIGLKNDLVGINHKKKLIVQFLAATLLVVIGNLRLTHFPFSLDIIEFGTIISYVISIAIIMFVINAYILNGAKGMVSSLGIIAGVTFGIWFYQFNKMQCAAMSFALVGTLLTQLIYVSVNKRQATQIGETGAKIVGFIIIALAFKLNAYGIQENNIAYNPTLVFMIMAIPTIDAARVIFLRIINKRSPFNQDKNHIHHGLVKQGFSESETTLLIAMSTVILVVGSIILFALEIRYRFQFGILSVFIVFIFCFSFSCTSKITNNIKKRRLKV